MLVGECVYSSLHIRSKTLLKMGTELSRMYVGGMYINPQRNFLR